MTLNLPPQPGPVLDHAATMVELLTICHHDGPRAATTALNALDDTTTRAVAHILLGSLYAAATIQAELVGADVAAFIRTLALNVANTPRRPA